MKNTTKLLSLLNNCSENKEESARVQLISEIIQSSDYRVLQGTAAIQRPFVANYSVAELEKLDNAELDKRKKLLHKLVSFHEQLLGCIQSGNGPMLSPDDSPDFTSEKSISRLLKKISLSKNKTNYSNIDPSNALAIFDASTVKSAQNCFDLLPVSLSKREEITESDITNNIGDTLYCIDISEFASIHKHFLEMSEKGETAISAEKNSQVEAQTIQDCHCSSLLWSHICIFSIWNHFGYIYFCIEFCCHCSRNSVFNLGVRN